MGCEDSCRNKETYAEKVTWTTTQYKYIQVYTTLYDNLYKCKFLLQSKFRSGTDPEAKAETDSQCAQIHEMLLLEKLASYSPVTKNEPNCALEEIPEKTVWQRLWLNHQPS